MQVAHVSGCLVVYVLFIPWLCGVFSFMCLCVYVFMCLCLVLEYLEDDKENRKINVRDWRQKLKIERMVCDTVQVRN
jgi:hypothetical protein